MADRKTNRGKTYVILPAYNEAESLPNLLHRFAELHEKHPEFGLIIQVVDDGSVDDTAKLAEQSYGDVEIRVHQHEQNMGLGQAMLTGVQLTANDAEGKDVIVAMDADDTHDVELIALMREKLAEGTDIAIASRFVEGGNDETAPPFRRLLSRGAAVVFRVVFPLERLGDFTSGYRMYRASLMKQALAHWGERLIEEDGFACMVELLLKLRHWKPVISEVPMVLRYDRKLGASKLRLMRTLAQYLKLALRNRLTPPPRQIKQHDAAYLSSH